MIKLLRSAFKLVAIVAREAWHSLVAAVRGDRYTARMHVCELTLSILEDASQVLVRLQRLMFRRPFQPNHVERVLIIKLDRIGDMVTTTPVFDALRERFPGAKLDIVAHPLPLSLLEGDDRLAERIEYRSWLYHPLPIRLPGPRTWTLLLRLMARRYDLVLSLRGSFSFLLLGLASPMTVTKFIVGEPVIRRYLRSAEELLGPLPNPPPRLSLTSENRRFAEGLYGASQGPRIAIHASASWQAKTWPVERFAALADALYERYDATVHFLGSSGDRDALQAIARKSQHQHHYHSSLRLPQVVAVIDAADLFIGNDSGLAHIAAAVGTPMVVIWGPANLNCSRPAAPEAKCTILYHDVPCRNGCVGFRCTNLTAFECLTRSSSDDVLAAATRLLQDAAVEPRSQACSQSI